MMTIYRDRPPPFDCAICGEPQMHDRWSGGGANMPIPPLCNRCTFDWGRCAIGGWSDPNPDRRTLRQVAALANALQVTAYCKQHGHRGPYGRA